MLSFYLIDMSLLEYDMLKYPPSLLPAAAVSAADCTLNSKKNWTRTCEVHSNYSEHHLLDCSKLMVNLHQKSSSGRLQFAAPGKSIIRGKLGARTNKLKSSKSTQDSDHGSEHSGDKKKQRKWKFNYLLDHCYLH